jgi:hypothetical protein
MIKIFIMFAIVFAICYFGIDAYRKLTGKKKLALKKVVAYSILCSVMSVSVLAAIVILF